ncbi:hypothetical protein AB0J80_20255 [Actinoplanes sp. NPDC049548]|uniref:hypothetical protein n=1 Tax=Actinoplanes sp. NPDC049548 TaxID=3155152 RepID=UPI00341C074B
MRLDDEDMNRVRTPDVMTDEQFERLAQAADSLAGTLESSAGLHDEMEGHLPGAAAHAVRDRRLAAAEREAAAAYRRRELPSDEVRRVIRNNGGDPERDAAMEQREIDAKRHETEVALREMAVGVRQQQLDDREEFRTARRDDRDRHAADRDRHAADRQRRADDRDRRADDRDRRADERERRADQREVDYEVEHPRGPETPAS